MKVQLIAHTPFPEETCAAAARLCYSDSDIASLVEKYKEGDHVALLTKILDLGHLSVLEHASFTFGVEGISRACSHQLVRHRIASYSQQSQRYVQAKQFEYVIPDSIADNEALAVEYKARMANTQIFYNHMLEQGIPAEDARFLLPNAATTKVVITMNARALINFFTERTCRRAQWEIRAMAIEMLRLIIPIAPTLFAGIGPNCYNGTGCTQGKMACGQQGEVISMFNELQNRHE